MSVGRCDYGRTMLWVTSTGAEQAHLEHEITAVLDGTISKSPDTGWRPSDRSSDPHDGVGQELSDDLWEYIDASGMELGRTGRQLGPERP